jgi:zinc ribbon protein
MHCPNCGKAASTDQQFCRICGLNLAEFSQLLREKLPSLKGELQEQKRSLERWALRLWTGAGAIFYVALYWAIISEIIIGKGHVLGGTLFLLVITALSVGGLLILYSSALEKRSKYMQADQKESLPKQNTAPELLSSTNPELRVSVTEHTTDLLESDSKEPERRTLGTS